MKYWKIDKILDDEMRYVLHKADGMIVWAGTWDEWVFLCNTDHSKSARFCKGIQLKELTFDFIE